MIVRPRPHWIRLLFVRRGSLIHRIAAQQLFIFTLSCAIVMAHGRFFDWKVTLTSGPFSLMGVALAIFLGFRINASYDRYWEARKQWGAVLVEARNLSRQALSLIAPGQDVRPFVLGLVGFASTMRNQLRGWPARARRPRWCCCGWAAGCRNAARRSSSSPCWRTRWKCRWTACRRRWAAASASHTPRCPSPTR